VATTVKLVQAVPSPGYQLLLNRKTARQVGYDLNVYWIAVCSMKSRLFMLSWYVGNREGDPTEG
jgi:hypothetical protein